MTGFPFFSFLNYERKSEDPSCSPSERDAGKEGAMRIAATRGHARRDLNGINRLSPRPGSKVDKMKAVHLFNMLLEGL